MGGEEELMKMTPGAKALSGRVPEKDPGDPEARFGWRRRSESLLENMMGYLGFLRRGVNIGQRGVRGGPTSPRRLGGAPLVTPRGRLVGVDLPQSSSSS